MPGDLYTDGGGANTFWLGIGRVTGRRDGARV